MKRVALAVLAAVLGVAALGSSPEAQRAPRPDVVLVMTDDQTVASLAAMPRVRRLLAARGTTFTRAFASYPLCCPSRATMLTGQYAHNHRVLGNRPPTGGLGALDPRETLPVWLRRAGYETAHVGKYLNGYGRDVPATVPPGWTEWHGAIDPSTYRMWGYTLNEDGTPRTYGRPNVEDPALYQTDVLRRKAVDIIRRRAGGRRPLYLSVAFLAPHAESARGPARGLVRPAPRHRDAFANAPLPRPAAFDEADVSDKPAFVQARPRLGPEDVAAATARHRGRLASLLAVDEAVAAIVDALRAAGRLERTLLVFTSDNGFFAGEHRVASGKYLPYEPSARVPLVVRGPGLAAGRTSSELAVNADLAATVLDAARARPGRVLDGRSLLPFARRPSRRTGRSVLLETAQTLPDGDLDQDGGPGVGTGQRRGGGVPTYRAVRTDRYVWIEWSTGDRELYDLDRDPQQLASRHADARYAAPRRVLARELRRLRGCRGSACRAAGARVPAPVR